MRKSGTAQDAFWPIPSLTVNMNWCDNSTSAHYYYQSMTTLDPTNLWRPLTPNLWRPLTPYLNKIPSTDELNVAVIGLDSTWQLDACTDLRAPWQIHITVKKLWTLKLEFQRNILIDSKVARAESEPECYRPYPRMIILRSCHQLPDGKSQNEGRVLCFAAGLLCTMAKGKEYSECTHDAEAILAHYRVDKPFKCFYQL